MLSEETENSIPDDLLAAGGGGDTRLGGGATGRFISEPAM